MTVATVPSGWGGGSWGASPWGSGAPPFRLLRAQAVRENVIRLYFTTQPLFTGLGGPTDAARVDRYSVAVVGGVGIDGEPCRPVMPAAVELAADPGSVSTEIDVFVDRPMTAWPAQYRVTAVGLVSRLGSFLRPGSSAVFDGARAGILPAVSSNQVASSDIANPQTRADLLGLHAVNPNAALGTFPVAPTGDYASDSPLSSYRKRVYRRLTSITDGFAHLAGYGVGLVSAVKRQARRGARERLAAIAEQQIMLEPETLSVTVQFTTVGDVTFYRVRARVNFSTEPVGFDVPVEIG